MTNVHGRNLAQARIESLQMHTKASVPGAFKTAQNITNAGEDAFKPNRAQRRHANKSKGKK